MTLLLTCVTPRFTVQASDRRLTDLDGQPVDELANKATLLCRFASFAYTGLARSSRVERTHELLMRSLAAPDQKISALTENLRSEATQAMRQVPLPSLKPSERLVARRTSFVGCGFVGMHNPERFGRQPTKDQLHPFLAVISNAQDLSESWRPVADQEYTQYIEYLSPSSAFKLHVAGQELLRDERVKLERAIARCLPRVNHPESVARLLVRAVRRVSERNCLVGPDVMCLLVRRANVGPWGGTEILHGGPVPLVDEARNEASYFRRMLDDSPSMWIFSPADPSDPLHYGPNFACDGIEIAGTLAGPKPLVDKSSARLRPGS